MSFLTRINYMKYAKHWLIFSIVLTLGCFGALGALGLNKGIDFTGGILLDVQFEQQVTNAQVEAAVAKVSPTTPVVKGTPPKETNNPNATEFLITVPELSPEAKDQLFKELEALGPYRTLGEETVSGSVSSELTRKAALAIAIAAVLQIIYITVRFQFKFGITAVIALLHDLVITLGLMSLFKVQINSAFVAAILTVLGYSMNDTVVVFDRIRENLKNRRKGEGLEALATRSIQEVITRSIYTGMTVQIMLVSMLIWGGDTIWDFTMTMFIGVTAGAYSSIFIAAALWLFWQQWEDKQKALAAKATGKPVKV